MLWYRYRLPFGAVVSVMALMIGEWINRYLNFWNVQLIEMHSLAYLQKIIFIIIISLSSRHP
jgi:hypothetical protein